MTPRGGYADWTAAENGVAAPPSARHPAPGLCRRLRAELPVLSPAGSRARHRLPAAPPTGTRPRTRTRPSRRPSSPGRPPGPCRSSSSSATIREPASTSAADSAIHSVRATYLYRPRAPGLRRLAADEGRGEGERSRRRGRVRRGMGDRGPDGLLRRGRVPHGPLRRADGRATPSRTSTGSVTTEPGTLCYGPPDRGRRERLPPALRLRRRAEPTSVEARRAVVSLSGTAARRGRVRFDDGPGS
ncbi:MAG: hypothetical protein M0C28_05410 [Candidatus Moduliflexus flocculans]|nr:hypothetical protein [Candidatus Moduliflexus flocculans]